MHNRTMLARLLLTGLALLPAGSASATVSMFFADVTTDQPLSNITVSQGGTFTVLLKLMATTEATDGVTYNFIARRATGADETNPFFRIIDRNIGTSPYNQPNRPDSEVENPSGNVNALDPHNLATELGASSFPIVVLPGTHRLAAYTFSVAANTTLANFTISTFNSSATGIGDPDPVDLPIAQEASIAVTVVPEPAAASVMALGLIALARRGRRR